MSSNVGLAEFGSFQSGLSNNFLTCEIINLCVERYIISFMLREVWMIKRKITVYIYNIYNIDFFLFLENNSYYLSEIVPLETNANKVILRV